MSRVKSLFPLVVLALSLLWPFAAIAADGPDPTTCLPDCYASNTALAGTTTPRDGTNLAPWLAPTPEERQALRDAVKAAVQQEGDPGSLTIIICNAAGCAYVLYEYAVDGTVKVSEQVPGIPPEVGVPLPVPYLLVGGVVLGVLLIVGGFILWRRARRLKPEPRRAGV
jgi:hypothetical protein